MVDVLEVILIIVVIACSTMVVMLTVITEIQALGKELRMADKELTDTLNQVLAVSQTLLQTTVDTKTSVDNEIAAVDALITQLQTSGGDPQALQTAQNILANLQNISGTIASAKADADAELAKVQPPPAGNPAPANPAA